MNVLVGKKITAVYLAKDAEAMRFDVEGGEPIVARTDGDCCSHTWVESVEGADKLVGGIVAKVEDIAMPELAYDHDRYEEVKFYGCQITTDKGSAVIDYRNSSNGYYGGSLWWPGQEYDSYYGGVYGPEPVEIRMGTARRCSADGWFS